jgi:DTW domain-containing protein YfiP
VISIHWAFFYIFFYKSKGILLRKALRPYRPKHKILPQNEGRAFCFECRKIPQDCLCKDIPSISNNIALAMLQHPNERTMPISTGKLTFRSLEDAIFRTGVSFDQDQLLEDWILSYKNPVLLFPSPEAIDIAEIKTPDALIVLDGTWREAKKMRFLSQNLQALPQVKFVAPHPSRYRIRKEPHPDFFSTIEAVHHCLTTWDTTCSYAGLLNLFDKMVEQQLSYIGKNTRHQGRRQRREEQQKRNKIRKWLYSMGPSKRMEILQSLTIEELKEL